LAEQVRAYEPILQKVIGDVAVVSWDVMDHRGRPRLVLRLREKNGNLRGEARAFFDPDELQSSELMAHRLHDIRETLIRIGDWRKNLDELYRKIREWCQSLAPDWRIDERLITISEVQPGEYQATSLRITEGIHSVDVRPVGHQIVGAEGRVDLVGEESSAILIFSPREGGWLWVDDRTVVRLRLLTGELFIDLVRGGMG
jgi:hypothetical protein